MGDRRPGGECRNQREVVAQLFSRWWEGPLKRLTPRELEVLGLTVGTVEKHSANIS
jgi:hypothetical protein